MTASADHPSRYERLVAGFAARVPGVVHTAVVSPEGLPLALSERLPREPGDQLAAVTAGVMSLARGAARCLDGGGVVQAVVEMERGIMLIAAIEDGAWLSVLARPSSDLGLIGHEMALFVQRAGEALTA